MRILVALGGNMISDAKKKGESFQEQMIKVESSAVLLTKLIEMGHSVIVTHGNGPQVGSLLLQQETDTEWATKLPLSILGALTQGQIGVSLQHALLNQIKNRNLSQQVYVIPTSVIVSSDDQGFNNPSKPVGPFYSEEEYNTLNLNGFKYIKKEQGYRRLVASPEPKEILETHLIKMLVEKGDVVIAVGGGGIPITVTDMIQRKDAVIDKDLASSLLAKEVEADMLIILTNVDGVYRNFGTVNEQFVKELSISEAESFLQNGGDSMSGSMGPKIQACINFAKTGKPSIITSANKLLQAIDGVSGTRII